MEWFIKKGATESNINSNSNLIAKLVDVAELKLLNEENQRLRRFF